MNGAVLNGSLSAFKLPEVLTFISMTRKTGTLTLKLDAREAYVFFSDGSLIYAGSNQEQFRLVSILQRKRRITREQARKYAFDWEDEPLLRVSCGESFEVETFDAGTGYFRSEADKAIPAKRPGFDRSPPLANPIAGPIWLVGAERGDTLVITIEDILVEATSWTAVGPRRGPLGESARWRRVERAR